MAGTVFMVEVEVGQKVYAGQVVVILESMKMEIPIETAVAGVVKEIYVKEGDFVDEDERLVRIE